MTSTTPEHATNDEKSKCWVYPRRNFKLSARLHLQYSLIHNTVGHLLEPAVEKSIVDTQQDKQLKVADLACGNCIWLSDLYTSLTSANTSAQLDGLDINPINFPASAYLPKSMSLKTLDILASPLATELIGIYDIVHIRTFASVIPDGDLTPVLTVASKLMKPGGYLQWEECRGDRFIVQSPSPNICKNSCDSIVQILMEGIQAKDSRNDWVDVLDTHLSQYGFQHTRVHRHENRIQDLQAWTEDHLMVWDELAFMFPSRPQEPDAQVTREAWLDLYAAAIRETEEGVVIHQGAVITAVGKKPL
jgi:hypothetical protein